MIRILLLAIAVIGSAICVAATLAFMPLVAAAPYALDAIDRITSQAMTAGLALSALGSLGLLAREAVSELRGA